MSCLEFRLEPVKFTLVKRDICVVEDRLFWASKFTGDQVGEVGEAEGLVEGDEICLHLTRPHHPDACQQDTVHVEEWLYTLW